MIIFMLLFLNLLRKAKPGLYSLQGRNKWEKYVTEMEMIIQNFIEYTKIF